MRIGIDARVLYMPVLKGMGVYLKNLLESLERIDKKNEYILYYDSRQQVVSRKPGSPNFEEKAISIRKGDIYHFWEQFRLPLELKKDRIDVFHSPANTTMLALKCPTIVTVHDTILQQSVRLSLFDQMYFKRLQPFILKKVQKIITISGYSKELISKIMKISKSMVEVIPLGINDSFRVITDKKMIVPVMQKYGITGSYLLNVGGESPWKNVSTLIKAYSELVKNYKIKEKLIITGIRNEVILKEHADKISELGIKDKIIIIGYVPQEDLVGLYNGASVFVYPSLHEGFGLPPLEAMACGVPVVVSDKTSIPEVVGDAAILVDASEPKNIAKAINDVLGNESLRKDLIAAGLERCKEFDWRKTAELTLKNYEEAYIAKKVNILYFEPSSGFGGSGNALFNLLKYINKGRFQYFVVTAADGPQFDRIKKLGVTIIKLGIKQAEPEDCKGLISYLKFIYDLIFNVVPNSLRLAYLIKKLKIDIIHNNTNINSGLCSILAAKITGITCICHVRQTKEFIKRETLFGKWINRIIVINKISGEIYAKYITKEKISLVYDGLDLNEYQTEYDPLSIRREFNLNGSACIGLVGRLVEGKGHDDFIKAAAIIVKSRPGAKFFIVGSDLSSDKRIENELKDLVGVLGLKDNVIFTGWRNDISKLISAFDILVQASSTFPEGFGLTCLEAMALNKPVVATNIPGPSDIVLHGKTGFIVPTKNPEKMAEAIVSLLDNPEMSREMGRLGRERLANTFNITNTVNRIEKIYEEELSRE